MNRTRKDILQSKAHIETAIALLQRELTSLNDLLGQISEPVALNEDFFWKTIFDYLEEAPQGISSSDLQSRLKSSGMSIATPNFRVFLSRNRKKGLLNYQKKANGTVLWTLSESAKQRKHLRSAKK